MGKKEKEVAELTLALHKAKERKTESLVGVCFMAVGAIALLFMIFLINPSAQYTDDELLEMWAEKEWSISDRLMSYVGIGALMGGMAVFVLCLAFWFYNNEFKKHDKEVFELQTKYNEMVK